MKKGQLRRQQDRTRNPSLDRTHNPAFANQLKSNSAASEEYVNMDGSVTCKRSICGRSGRRKENDEVVSARKIILLLHANAGLGLQPNSLDPRLFFHANSKGKHLSPNLMHELASSNALPDPSMEKATKWDCSAYSLSRIQEVSSMRNELDNACAHITGLEIEQSASRKKLDRVVKKLEKEKESWRRREQEKIQGVVEYFEDELQREIKNRKGMEILNWKLVSELGELNSSAKGFMWKCKKERKARKLIEEVQDGVVNRMEEEKARYEGIREEVEEEKEMLQMVEVWQREERVQRKLDDAKLTFEKKYPQLCELQAQVLSFLNRQNSSNLIKDLGTREESNAGYIIDCSDDKKGINGGGVEDDSNDDAGWETASSADESSGNASAIGLNWDETGETGN